MIIIITIMIMRKGTKKSVSIERFFLLKNEINITTSLSLSTWFFSVEQTPDFYKPFSSHWRHNSNYIFD